MIKTTISVRMSGCTLSANLLKFSSDAATRSGALDGFVQMTVQLQKNAGTSGIPGSCQCRPLL